MKKCFVRVAILCFFSLSLFNCKKEETPVPVNTPTSTTGSVIGFYTLRDEFGNKLPDQRGLKVIVENSNPEISAITDSNGRFILNDIKPGPLTLVLEKEGFGTSKRFIDNVFTGGNSPYILKGDHHYPFTFWNLCQKSNTKILDFSVKDTTTNRRYITLQGVLNPDSTNKRNVQIFLGKDLNVSKDNYVEAVVINFYSIDPSNLHPIQSFSKGLSLQELERVGFQKGDIIYAIVYGAPLYIDTYFNISNGKSVYSNLSSSPSNIVSFRL